MRSRTRSSPPILGRGWRWNQPNTDEHGLGTAHTERRETVQDNPPGYFHDFTVYRHLSKSGLVNGTDPGSGSVFRNFCPDNFSSPDTLNDIASIPGSPTDGEAATELLAKTNPSRPVVSVPNFILELRDIPRLLKLEGDTALKKAASANLSVQFGLLPLIGDLTKLLSFQDVVSQRQKELEMMFQSGLRRKRQLFSGTHNDSIGPQFVHSNSFHMYYECFTRVSTERVWGYVEWVPSTLPPKTANEMRALARKAVLGLTIDFSTAWEAIPFSWLIDWCSNVGDFLIAKQNTIGAVPHNISIMRHRKGESQWDYVWPPRNGFVPQSFMRSCEIKSRRSASPALSAQLPWLSARQMSIVGSIGVLRRVPRSAYR